MFSKYSALALALFSATATAQIFAEMVPQSLNARSERGAGGFVLVSSTSVPHTQSCGAGWYCPISDTLQCVGRGTDTGNSVDACCPSTGDTDCMSAIQKDPFCADSSWVLWNATLENGFATGYFCCEQGQIGLQTLMCVDANTISSPTGLAIEISISSSTTVAIPISTKTVGSSNSTSTLSNAAASSSAAASTAAVSSKAAASSTVAANSSSAAPSTLAKTTSASAVPPTTTAETNPVATSGAVATPSASTSAKSNGGSVAGGKGSALVVAVVAGFGLVCL